MQDESFGELREWLHHPGTWSWKRVLAQVETWPDARERQERVIPYCLHHLGSWPRELRTLEIVTRSKSIEFEHRDALMLSSGFHVTGAGLNAKKLGLILKYADEVQPESLVIDCGLDADAIEILAQRWCRGGKLRALRFGRHMRLPRSQLLTLLDALDAPLEHFAWSCANIRPEEIDAFIAHPTLAELSALELLNYASSSLEPPWWEALFASPTCANLRALTLIECLPPASLETLLEAEFAPQLEDLAIRAGRQGLLPLGALARDDTLAKLERLDLSGQPVGFWTHELFAEHDWPALRELRLERCQLDDEAAEVLASAPSLGKLERLDLSNNTIRPRGGVALAKSETLIELAYLDLGINPLNQATMAILAEADHLGRRGGARHQPLLATIVRTAAAWEEVIEAIKAMGPALVLALDEAIVDEACARFGERDAGDLHWSWACRYNLPAPWLALCTSYTLEVGHHVLRRQRGNESTVLAPLLTKHASALREIELVVGSPIEGSLLDLVRHCTLPEKLERLVLRSRPDSSEDECLVQLGELVASSMPRRQVHWHLDRPMDGDLAEQLGALVWTGVEELVLEVHAPCSAALLAQPTSWPDLRRLRLKLDAHLELLLQLPQLEVLGQLDTLAIDAVGHHVGAVLDDLPAHLRTQLHATMGTTS